MKIKLKKWHKIALIAIGIYLIICIVSYSFLGTRTELNRCHLLNMSCDEVNIKLSNRGPGGCVPYPTPESEIVCFGVPTGQPVGFRGLSNVSTVFFASPYIVITGTDFGSFELKAFKYEFKEGWKKFLLR